MEPTIFSQFECLRAHVESTMARPSVVMVTSAKPRDGKSLTAYGLTERLADSGRRVVLVEYREGDDMYPPRHSDIATRRAFPIVTLPLDRDGSTVASPALRDSVDDLRAKYEYAIVDAAPMLKSRLAILLAGIVDGILVTVRLGRTSDADDAALVATLQRVDASVLGVVAAAPKDVDAFAGSSDSHHQNDYIAPMLPASTLEHARFPAFEARPR